MRGNNMITSVFAAVLGLAALAGPAPAVEPVGVDPETGLATAVVVEDRALAHTAQLGPVDAAGTVQGDSLDAQLGQVVQHLAAVLGDVGAGLDSIARLNVYVAEDALASEATGLLKAHLGPEAHPAVTIIVSRAADPAVLVTADAVAAVAPERAPDAVTRHTSNALPAPRGAAHVAVLPAGRTLYISGMAARGTDNLAEASTGTMEQLHDVLALNEVSAEHVVHLKNFMKPPEGVAEAEEAMAAFYPGAAAPPMTFVHWLNGLPAEIELIAWLPGPGDGAETVSLRWRPEEDRSPVYCRFAVVDSPVRIYTKGFTASAALDAEGQVHNIFGQLHATLNPLGSDFRHLVKATYYVTAEDTSTALNAIRPAYYDPERPPAASKATVVGSGSEDKRLVLDMIAVPEGR